ncbi:hypothetical protein GCM10009715_05760 [Paeniglutamicibacter psychrophenolicus]|uniref:DNA-binding XRE family transcriptional regulator n=1 Tax=Paeniglutamicibacter psychrophenolicus TaxID=257454 RepID=A0ABS4WE06_9MICC|nr:helix-turn-helix transcriptional regulator [Paeniglutamicibacter psychrophenolicus]MBP2374373.1 DNA-binding XRE family transcriptional regulator [Paeniglutamicibacter psychrophenolicus]
MRVQDAMQSHNDGLTQAKMAREIGMSRDALSRSLSGQRNFSATELAKLSKVLEVSLSWLVTGDPRPEGSNGRAGQAAGWKHDSVAETVAFPAGAYREVGLSTGTVPQLEPGLGPEEGAAAVATLLDAALGQDFVHDLPAAIERAYGIGVFVAAEGPAFDARAMRTHDVTYIMVRGTGAWYQANLVLARELGALLGGRHEGIGIRTQAEDGWARDFALALLLPAARLRSIDWNRQTPRELAGFLWESGASAKALAHRLDALGIGRGPAMVHADEGTLQLLVWQDPECLSHHRAGAYRAPRIPADLFGAHLFGMRRGVVDGSSLAWMLDTPLSEL